MQNNYSEETDVPERVIIVRHFKNSQIEGIQNEYKRINTKWLQMHYRLLIWLALFTVFMELVMFFVLGRIGTIVASDTVYLVKYLLIPSACNLSICGAALLFMRRPWPETRKMYAISMLTVAMAILVCFFHAIFKQLFLVFTIPALLTIAYGNRKLTAITCGISMLGKTVSDLFLCWDPEDVHTLSNPDTLLNFILSLILLGLFYAICFLLIAVEKEKSEVSINLERDRQRYQEESITDPLTRVGNRQALRMAFQHMEADRDNQYFLAMMDLDDFKLLNDTYGHNCGDRFLQSLGSILLAAATDQVMPFRFGGDEFCVLFCGCQREEVLTVCQMIQEQFLQAEIHRIYKTVSVSIGIAIHLAEERPSQLIERADTALYQAKQDKGSIWMEP